MYVSGLGVSSYWPHGNSMISKKASQERLMRQWSVFSMFGRSAVLHMFMPCSHICITFCHLAVLTTSSMKPRSLKQNSHLMSVSHPTLSTTNHPRTNTRFAGAEPAGSRGGHLRSPFEWEEPLRCSASESLDTRQDRWLIWLGGDASDIIRLVIRWGVMRKPTLIEFSIDV